jgi:hypothetical protein
MAALRLTGPEIAKLQELLRAAFLRPRFDEFLLYRLDKRTDDYVGPADDYKTALRKVIQEANARLWWRDLLREARRAVPDDPGLMVFGEPFGLSPATVAPDGRAMAPVQGRQLELKIRAAQSTYDIGTWRKRLGEIEGRVCRIEYPAEMSRGTGFLVGPSVVLTNYHVVEPIILGNVSAAHVALRFDYKKADESAAVQAGTVHRLDDSWLVDSSPYSPCDLEVDPAADPALDELDYAVLRVEGTPGREPVGGTTRDPNPALRGWIRAPGQQYDFSAHPSLYIVQHPDGKPMQVALDTEAVIGLNANGTRIRYTTTTEPGSSGSPCFGPDWQWVALHHSGDPKYWQGQQPDFNQGVPLSAIRTLLASRRKLELLGGEVGLEP